VYQRILVPLDGSASAEAALPHARSLASRFGAEILLLRVDAPIPNVPARRYPPEIEGEAIRHLRRLAEPMTLRHLRVRTLVEYGDPGATIVRVARDHRVDLIVMARGRRRLLGALGSVARKVVGHSPVAVLVVEGG
jgi:nucleotide-binding universal stress UspA family protein